MLGRKNKLMNIANDLENDEDGKRVIIRSGGAEEVEVELKDTDQGKGINTRLWIDLTDTEKIERLRQLLIDHLESEHPHP